MGEGTVAVEVVLNADAIFENVVGSMRQKFAREFGDGAAAAPNTTAAAPAPADGWDYAGRMPNTFIGRQGHIGVTVSTQTFDVAHDTLAALARVVRDRLPDQPFAEPPPDPVLAEIAAMNKKAGIEPGPEPLPPDTCALLTRAEAEAVLGPLLVAPYRSAKNTPFASATGASCSYYSANHRALVLSPEWSNGKMLFNMVKGVGGLVGAATGSKAPGGTDTGPWDQVAGDVTGVLHFLKGDRVLEMQYHTSSTDRAGALKLAAVAVNRL